MNEYLEKDVAFGKKFSKTRQFQEAYNSKVKDSTTISRQVGNIYTGSLYLGLVSLAELHKLVCLGRGYASVPTEVDARHWCSPEWFSRK